MRKLALVGLALVLAGCYPFKTEPRPPSPPKPPAPPRYTDKTKRIDHIVRVMQDSDYGNDFTFWVRDGDHLKAINLLGDEGLIYEDVPVGEDMYAVKTGTRCNEDWWCDHTRVVVHLHGVDQLNGGSTSYKGAVRQVKPLD